MRKLLLTGTALLVLFAACRRGDDGPADAEDLKLGGETTSSGTYITAFQQPAANLSEAESALHLAADKAFGDIFVTAPATVNSGLGPIFNQNSCENCHVANGRSPFPTDAADLRGLLFRISVAGAGSHGEPLAVPGFGGQLQTRALFGKQPEASLSWKQVEEIRTYLDGEQITLSKPVFSIENPYQTWPSGAMMSPRMAPPVIGLGLLEAVAEADITALADPDDANGDGISGRPNRVWDYKNQQVALGRFGWKAGQPNLIQQSAAAYNQDMGVTSPYFPTESSDGQPQADGLADEPEIDEATLKATVFYPQSLAVPERRNSADKKVAEGRKLFLGAKCGSCHNPKFTTGAHPEHAFLSHQTIFPYTDLLLHDMGDGLADNRPDFEASGREWRTPPLWGIGLTQVVGGPAARFLHDGRARTLEEAILWHGGEAQGSVDNFTKMGKTEREKLVLFLQNL